MTREQFVKWLKDEITLSGALSIDLPEAEYNRVIDREKKELYNLYPNAVKHQFCIIPVEVFRTPEFRKNRTIQFPECVIGVGKFEEMKRRNSLFGINDPDFAFDKSFQADMWLGSQMNMDSIMFRTVQWSLWDQLKVFTLIDIHHKWNEIDHTMYVDGHDPYCNVFCEVYTTAPDSELFEDVWARKYISAKCKLQVAKMLGMFTTNLIGGVTVNYSLYTDEAKTDIEECKTYFKELVNGNHFFLTTP